MLGLELNVLMLYGILSTCCTQIIECLLYQRQSYTEQSLVNSRFAHKCHHMLVIDAN